MEIGMGLEHGRIVNWREVYRSFWFCFFAHYLHPPLTEGDLSDQVYIYIAQGG